MLDFLGLRRHERRALVLGIIFGLIGAWLTETFGEFGEYMALFICLPSPVIVYMIGEIQEGSRQE